LTAADALQLLGAAPDPASAGRLSIGQITAALKRDRRRNIAEKAAAIQAALRAEQLRQPVVVSAEASRRPRRASVLRTCADHRESDPDGGGHRQGAGPPARPR
jgi:hypothetical protein